MRYLILSDIHSNCEALTAVLAHVRRKHWDKAVVLGDIVGYGANPNQAVEMVRELKPLVAIRGNHDKVCAGVEDGEVAFREMECEEARALVALPRRVVAAGGGAFTRAATRALLQEGALTIWLRCDLNRILARIPADGSRPLAGNRDIMRALLAEREPSYRLADVTVDTSRRTPREVVERIVEFFESVRP